MLLFLIVACKDHGSTSKLPNICFQKDGIDFLTFHLFFKILLEHEAMEKFVY